MYMKKSRGQKRRLKLLLKNIDRFVPYEDCRDPDCEFEHFHVPSTPWIEMPKTSGRIKTAFIRKWLEKTELFIKLKPEGLPFCKVVAVVCEPYLWDSQIIIFYSEKYYSTFWDRKGPYQTWTKTDVGENSMSAQRNIPTPLPVECYTEVIAEEDYTRTTRLWYYGEVLGS